MYLLFLHDYFNISIIQIKYTISCKPLLISSFSLAKVAD